MQVEPSQNTGVATPRSVANPVMRMSALTRVSPYASRERAARDIGVQIGAQRSQWPTCLADAQQMANSQANASFARAAEASLPDGEPLTSTTEKFRVDSDGHSTCSTNDMLDANEARFQAISSTPKGVEVRGRMPHTIPSAQMGGPDFRDLARFEWRVRKTSRRDSQCVPI